MRGHLSTEVRLQISVTRLKKSVVVLRSTVKELSTQLKERGKKIAELEAKLVDKESERKELLSYLYKPGKKTEESSHVARSQALPHTIAPFLQTVPSLKNTRIA